MAVLLPKPAPKPRAALALESDEQSAGINPAEGKVVEIRLRVFPRGNFHKATNANRLAQMAGDIAAQLAAEGLVTGEAQVEVRYDYPQWSRVYSSTAQK